MKKVISKWGTLLSLALSATTLPVISAEESPKRLPADPYGVCCHTTREERWDAPALYPLMKKAGVNLVRFDIDQLYLETKPGFFQPEYKELMLSPMKEGLDLLAIIGPWTPTQNSSASAQRNSAEKSNTTKSTMKRTTARTGTRTPSSSRPF